MKTGRIIVMISIALLISYFIFSDCPRKEPISTLIEKIRIDTVYTLRESKPLIIEKARTRIVTLRDTIICFQPFSAVLDTIISRDTVRSVFTFPENLFTLEIRRHPDSLMIRNVFTKETIVKERKWWEDALLVLAGAGAGYFISGIIK